MLYKTFNVFSFKIYFTDLIDIPGRKALVWGLTVSGTLDKADTWKKSLSSNSSGGLGGGDGCNSYVIVMVVEVMAIVTEKSWAGEVFQAQKVVNGEYVGLS